MIETRFEKIKARSKKYGECPYCGGEIILDSNHREFVCSKCGRILKKPGKSFMQPTRCIVTVCPNCQARKRKPRKVLIVEYNNSGYGYCPLCGFKYRF